MKDDELLIPFHCRILLASRFWNAFLVGSVALSALVLVAFSMFYQIFPVFGSTYVIFHMLASPGIWVRHLKISFSQLKQ